MSVDNINAYWDECAKRYIDWFSPYKTVRQGDFSNLPIRWFHDGQLNLSYNCLDRHLEKHRDKVALIYEGDEPSEQRQYTFQALHQAVCQMANYLKSQGINKGDVVAIYLPLSPVALIAMLACARIGAIHTVIFAGFSAQAIESRLIDAKAKLLLTTEGYFRGGKWISLLEPVRDATCNLSIKVEFWHDENKLAEFSEHCPPTSVEAEHPLFILYTSGSTGKPKGLVHTTGGYAVQVATSFHEVFAPKISDIFWCTADVGWITGHSYLVYGALLTATTTLMSATTPVYPNPGRFFSMIERYQVSIFYTAPTLLRAIKKEGDEWVTQYNLDSLRLLGSVGEPINPEVWQWYWEVIGQKRCNIVDTWWQTETGAIMISPKSEEALGKPGYAMKPLKGIFPKLLADGRLVMTQPWPSMARTILGDFSRYQHTYIENGQYITGDGAQMDDEGNFCITGRVDDVLNVSGHRLGTAEIESALLTNPLVSEAAVVGYPHEIKGEGIYAFVSLKSDGGMSFDSIANELKKTVASVLSPIAKPDQVQIVKDLPKTRSGKIMRRILRLVAEGRAHQIEDLGDVSTLANPESVIWILKK